MRSNRHVRSSHTFVFAAMAGCAADRPTFDASGQPGPKTVMCVGDSITYGMPGNIGGYRRPLAAQRPDLIFVGRQDSWGLHEGYSGKRIDEIKTIVAPAIEQFEPRIVLLLAGTNDIAQGQSAASLAQEMRDYVATLPGQIFVGSIPRILGPLRQASIDYNAAISTMPEFVDVGGTLLNQDMSDPYHPNPTGYTKMATTWANVLAEVAP